MKKLFQRSVLTTAMFTAAAMLALLSARANSVRPVRLPAVPIAPARNAVAVPVPPPVIVTNAIIRPSSLDARRQYALGMIETGNDDAEIGGLGEISRFQIMPSVWEQYSGSRNYQNPAAARTVAQQHWATLYARFRQQAHREPTDFDMYVLWNTRTAYYANRDFNPAKLAATVRDRAQRFVNLVESAGL
jgi:hypothetical protein